MSVTPPPLPPPLPPQGASPADSAAHKPAEFYFHGPPQEIQPGLGGIGKVMVGLLHLVGIAAIYHLGKDSAPTAFGEAAATAYVWVRVAVMALMAFGLFVVARLPFRSANQNIVQPLLLICCYSGMAAFSLSSNSLGRQIDRQMAESKNQSRINELSRKAESMDREQIEKLQGEGVLPADSGSLESRKQAWDEMVGSVDAEAMNPTERRLFAAAQEIVAGMFEESRKFAEAAANSGNLDFGGLHTRMDVLAARNAAESLREANLHFREYIDSMPELLDKTLRSHGVGERDAQKFAREFLDGMRYDSQKAVRRLEDERMDALIVLFDLLLHHDGGWEQANGEFLFEEDQAIEDFNVIVEEISRLEETVAGHQQRIFSASQERRQNRP